MAAKKQTHNRKKISLKVRITQLNRLISSNNLDRLTIAYTLQDTNRNTHWRTTAWGSFQNFCKKEILMSYGSVSSYTTMVNKAERLGYTSVELGRFLQFIPWSSLMYLIAHATKKASLKQVKAMYALGHLMYYQKINRTGEETFRVGLPADYAQKFTGILLTCGMQMQGAKRINVRAAMMAFLDTQP